MFSGKTALVTGGSGALGSAICRTLSRSGAAVAFTWFRHEESAAELAAELECRGARYLSGKVDGSDGASVRGFVARVEAELGEVDILVNNLGVTQVMPFALIGDDDWDRTITVNLKSMFLFTKAAVRAMIRNRSGVVINLGSVAGHRMMEAPVHYATAKAGVSGFTLSLAKELCQYGIRVNCVAPGLLDGGAGANVSDRQRADYEKFCALGRVGRPDEVAEIVAFLASDKASYLNAQTLFADGGL